MLRSSSLSAGPGSAFGPQARRRGSPRGRPAKVAAAVGALACIAAFGLTLAGCAEEGERPTDGGTPGTGILSEDAATAKAIAYLNETDYGEGRIQVRGNIKDVVLMTTGHNDCGAITRPVWAFHVHAKFEGWLYLDGVSGAKVCSSLPFLR